LLSPNYDALVDINMGYGKNEGVRQLLWRLEFPGEQNLTPEIVGFITTECNIK